LCIGVNRNEFNSAQTCVNHSVDGVDATSTDTNDFDDCEIILWCSGHEPIPPKKRPRRTLFLNDSTASANFVAIQLFWKEFLAYLT
jgi:hypothetical protein